MRPRSGKSSDLAQARNPARVWAPCGTRTSGSEATTIQGARVGEHLHPDIVSVTVNIRECARGEVVAPFDGAGAHGAGVEHHHVGPAACRQPAAVGQPVQPGRHVAEQPHRPGQAEHAGLALQGQKAHRIIEGREHVEVGAAVGGADDHARVGPGGDPGRPRPLVIGLRSGYEPRAQPVGQGDVAEDVDRIAPGIRRDVADLFPPSGLPEKPRQGVTRRRRQPWADPIRSRSSA